MRLDKFIGKAKADTIITVFEDGNEFVLPLFHILNGIEYSEHKKEMKQYRVLYYEIDNDGLKVLVEK